MAGKNFKRLGGNKKMLTYGITQGLGPFKHKPPKPTPKKEDKPGDKRKE